LNSNKANGRRVLGAVAWAFFLADFACNSAAHGETQQLVYRQITCHQYGLAAAAIPKEVQDALNRPAATEAESRQGERWKLSPRGLIEIGHSGKAIVWTPQKGLPILPLTSIAVGEDDWVWIGTPDGAICFRPGVHGGERWFYFWGRRYLADNAVLNVVAEPHWA